MGVFEERRATRQRQKSSKGWRPRPRERERGKDRRKERNEMALERVPADIRKDGGVARMSDPEMIKEILEAVTIPVMAKARIGHFVEAQILEAIGVDYIFKSGDPARRAKAIVE